jgi:hypothetical protein
MKEGKTQIDEVLLDVKSVQTSDIVHIEKDQRVEQFLKYPIISLLLL